MAASKSFEEVSENISNTLVVLWFLLFIYLLICRVTHHRQFAEIKIASEQLHPAAVENEIFLCNWKWHYRACLTVKWTKNTKFCSTTETSKVSCSKSIWYHHHSELKPFYFHSLSPNFVFVISPWPPSSACPPPPSLSSLLSSRVALRAAVLWVRSPCQKPGKNRCLIYSIRACHFNKEAFDKALLRGMREERRRRGGGCGEEELERHGRNYSELARTPVTLLHSCAPQISTAHPARSPAGNYTASVLIPQKMPLYMYFILFVFIHAHYCTSCINNGN